MASTPPCRSLRDQGSGGGVPRFSWLKGFLLLAILSGIACGGADDGSPGEAAARSSAVAAAAGHAAAGPESKPDLSFQGDPHSPAFGTIQVRNLPPAALAGLSAAALDTALWESLFPLYTGEALPSDGTYPSVLGTWSVEGTALRFSPRFPLATGILYTTKFDGPLFDSLTGHGGEPTPILELTFSMPDPGMEPTTVVEATSPGDGLVPENLLRLYVHFSAPMKEQKVHGAVHLYDDSGEEVTLPFVEIPEGLWDRDHRRLTLIFHPGRLKRGVGPNQAMGTPLQEGRRYRLVVESTLKDAQGYPLASEFETRFTVGPADRTSPDPRSWKLSPPSGPDAPLRVQLDEPLDRALLTRLVTVENEAGRGVHGSVVIGDGARDWTFTPAEPWTPGSYILVVNPALEDLAGNTPAGLFDTETQEDLPDRSRDANPIRLAFHVGS